MAGSTDLGPCADLARTGDNDRFLCALFAPAEARADLMALAAFNLELATAGERVSEPLLGQIRLQWWREAVDEAFAGRPRSHPVASGLARAAARRPLRRDLIEAMIVARERDLEPEPPADLADLIDYARATSTGLIQLGLDVLAGRGADPAAADLVAEPVGIAWALIGLVRATPALGRRGRVMIPREVLRRHGLTRHDVLERRQRTAVRAAIRDLVDEAEARLAAARDGLAGLERSVRAAFLPAALARLYLRRARRAGHDPWHPLLGHGGVARHGVLAWAAATGRL